MRFLFLSLLCLCLNAEIQRAKIIQTYVYPAAQDEFKQELQKGAVILVLLSENLIAFMNSAHPKERLETQVVHFNDGYTEFKSLDQSIQTYSNSLGAKLKFNFTDRIYEMEYLGNAQYRLKNTDTLIPNVKMCRFVMQKTLTSLIDGRKDFVINLDNQHYFSRVLATHWFLQCANS